MKNNKEHKKLDSYLKKYGLGGVIKDPVIQSQLGGFLQGAGLSLASSGLEQLWENKNKTGLVQRYNQSYTPVYGMGGQVPVEVEGNEVAETPQGENLEFNGQSHEEGGIKTNLPQGTKIYSDRLEIEGKSMADRKKDRERTKVKLEKLLENRKGDKIAKQSAQRTLAQLASDEQKDLQIQEVANQIYNQPSSQKALGGTLYPHKRYAFGTPDDDSLDTNPLSIINSFFPNNLPINPSEMTLRNRRDSFYGDKLYDSLKVEPYDPTLWNKDINGNLTPKTQSTTNFNDEESRVRSLAENELQALNTPTQGLSNDSRSMVSKSLMDDLPTMYKPDTEEISTLSTVKTLGQEQPYTTGDKMLLASNVAGGVIPLASTIANRMGDKPNRNFFKNYGKEALSELEKSIQSLQTTQGLAQRDLDLQQQGLINRNRNSARSLNTIRGLDISSQQLGNSSSNDLFSKFATQNANLYSQKANMLNQVTAQRLQGETNRDLADRQDRDNYFNQMQKSLLNSVTQMSNTGKALNSHKLSEDKIKLLPELNKFGITYTYDKNGNIVINKESLK